MTDVDHYEREGGKVTAARALAAEAGIQLAVSDPCFELWLLLRHETCARHCADCGAVQRRLTAFVPAYDKARLRFADFADGLDTAVERARSLTSGRNPSTDMWRLVTALLEAR